MFFQLALKFFTSQFSPNQKAISRLSLHVDIILPKQLVPFQLLFFRDFSWMLREETLNLLKLQIYQLLNKLQNN